MTPGTKLIVVMLHSRRTTKSINHIHTAPSQSFSATTGNAYQNIFVAMELTTASTDPTRKLARRYYRVQLTIAQFPVNIQIDYVVPATHAFVWISCVMVDQIVRTAAMKVYDARRSFAIAAQSVLISVITPPPALCAPVQCISTCSQTGKLVPTLIRAVPGVLVHSYARNTDHDTCADAMMAIRYSTMDFPVNLTVRTRRL